MSYNTTGLSPSFDPLTWSMTALGLAVYLEDEWPTKHYTTKLARKPESSDRRTVVCFNL